MNNTLMYCHGNTYMSIHGNQTGYWEPLPITLQFSPCMKNIFMLVCGPTNDPPAQVDDGCYGIWSKQGVPVLCSGVCGSTLLRVAKIYQSVLALSMVCWLKVI